MSAVPPNIAGSVLQSGLAQQQVSAVRDAERNQRAGADRQVAKAVDQADNSVETTDDTTEVYTDAEGSGSQGRAFSNPDEESETTENAENPPTPPDADGDQGRIIDLNA